MQIENKSRQPFIYMHNEYISSMKAIVIRGDKKMITLKITEKERGLLIRAVSECSFAISDSWSSENLETGEWQSNIPSNEQKDIDDLDKLEDKIRGK